VNRRVINAGVAASFFLVLGFRAVPTWWRWRADVRATAAEAIAQERRVASVVGGFSQSLDSLGARVGRLKRLGPAFLTGATPAEAASMLAALVGEAARTSLVRIDGIEIHVDSARGADMPHVRVEAEAVGDVAGLAALVHTLEQGPTLLAVQRLAVHPQAVDAPAGQVESLAIRFTVEGLALLTPKRETP
jgi:hypothetical protein